MRNKFLEPNTTTFTNILNACAYHFQPEKLQQVLDNIKATLPKITPGIYNAIIHAHLKTRDLPKAVQVLLVAPSN
jgi:hypothetical protein